MTYIKTKLHREIVIDSIITLHYFEYMKDFVFHGESHDFWEFLYVDKGTVLVCSGDHWLTLNTGDIIFHKPNEFHAIRSIGKSSPNLIAASFTTSSPAILFFENTSFTLNKEERYYISQLISEGRNAFSTPMHIPSVEKVELRKNPPFASQQLVLLYLELFLVMVRRNHQDEHPLDVRSGMPGGSESGSGQHPFLTETCEEPAEKTSSRNILFQEILQFLEFHICESLTVTDICSCFPISRSALQALFHEKYGCGIMEHFNNMKIRRAKEIIRSGTMNLTETAYFLSYSSLPYFSKQFKKVTGMSPMQYANSVKGLTEALQNDSPASDL